MNNQEKIKQALQQIDDGLAAISTDESWLKFLSFQALFYNYSFNNAMLIYCQNPEAKAIKSQSPEIPIWQRTTLSLEEAAEYSGIGIHKLRELADMRGCRFVLRNGNRRRIKRKLLDEFLENADAI